MTTDPHLPFSATLEIRDRCICLHVQRAARVIARRFDEGLRPVGLTNGHFSVLMALNRPAPGPRISDLVPLLGMDRTTVTATLKVLGAAGLGADSAHSKTDARARRLRLTDAGRGLLADALPIWRSTHDAIDAEMAPADPDDLREGLDRLAGRKEG